MLVRRVLLMYIGFNSGHHQAARAIEGALHSLSPEVSTLGINSLNYTNPVLEKIINKTYLEIIRRKPEVWEYLYDNHRVAGKTRRLRDLFRRYNSSRLKALLDNFQPEAVICTQAFPCGMVAEYKRSYNKNLYLFGVLTDYAPHFYWLDEDVDCYFSPSTSAREKLIASGIDPRKVEISGIPIEAKFAHSGERESLRKKWGMAKDAFVILVMGGSQGLGPLPEIISALDRTGSSCEIAVVAGTNKRLRSNLERKKKAFKKKISIYGFCQEIDELMEASDLLITKPGGLSIAEAMAKSLPMVIINPIPGQEAKNTQYLLEKKVARMAKNVRELARIVEELIADRSELLRMKKNAKETARPRSAFMAARFILEAKGVSAREEKNNVFLV